MTVIREQCGRFQDSEEKVVETIEAVLANRGSSYRYTKTSYDTTSKTFSTIIIPPLYPLTLSTQFFITVIAKGSVTEVVVRTKSQLFIMGDIFNQYNKYIEEFLDEMKKRLTSAE